MEVKSGTLIRPVHFKDLILPHISQNQQDLEVTTTVMKVLIFYSHDPLKEEPEPTG